MASKHESDCHKSEDETELKHDKAEKVLTCDLCEQEEGLVKVAVAFCVECQDYLCRYCFLHHCRPRPMRHHRILKEDEMPKKKAIMSVSDKCSYHTGESNTFYCETHDEICCHSCIATMHRTCEIKALSEVAKNYATSEKYAESKDELKAVEDSLRKQIKQFEVKIASCRKSVEKALKDLTKHRNEINNHFDKLEKDIKDEATYIQTEDSRKLHDLILTPVDKLKDIEQMNADLAILEDTKQERLLFAAVNCNKKQIANMKSEIKKLQTTSTVRLVKFCHSRTSSSMAVRKDLLGYLQVYEEREENMKGEGEKQTEEMEERGYAEEKQAKIGEKEEEKVKNEREKEKETGEEVQGNEEDKDEGEKDDDVDNISSTNNEFLCETCEDRKVHFDCQQYHEIALPKLVRLSETSVTVLDYYKSKISLHTDSDPNECANMIFTSGPWDMTKVETNMLAATLPHEKKIKFLYVDNAIEEADEITTPGFCRSIAAVYNFLVVTFSEPAGLKLLSKSGEILRTIPMMERGRILFSAPSSVAAGDGSIFVADPGLNNVTCMDSHGDTKKILKLNDSSKPAFVSYSNEKLFVSLNQGFKFFYTTSDFTNIKKENENEDDGCYSTTLQVTNSNTIAFHGIGIWEDDDDDDCDDEKSDAGTDDISTRNDLFSNTNEVEISSDSAEHLKGNTLRKTPKKQCTVS